MHCTSTTLQSHYRRCTQYEICAKFIVCTFYAVEDLCVFLWLKDGHLLNRGYNMSAHALLNSWNELGKRENDRLAEHLSLIRNEFYKFNNRGARIYQMTLKVLRKRVFLRENAKILQYYRPTLRFYNITKICKTTSGISILEHDVIPLLDATSYDYVL